MTAKQIWLPLGSGCYVLDTFYVFVQFSIDMLQDICSAGANSRKYLSGLLKSHAPKQICLALFPKLFVCGVLSFINCLSFHKWDYLTLCYAIWFFIFYLETDLFALSLAQWNFTTSLFQFNTHYLGCTLGHQINGVRYVLGDTDLGSGFNYRPVNFFLFYLFFLQLVTTPTISVLYVQQCSRLCILVQPLVYFTLCVSGISSLEMSHATPIRFYFFQFRLWLLRQYVPFEVLASENAS